MEKVNLKNLLSDKPQIKYCEAKKAIAVAKNRPAELYPHFDFFVKFLDSEKQVMRWVALQIVGYLAWVDKKNKIKKLLPRLIKMLNSGNLITTNNDIIGLTEIAKAKPEYQNKIINELLKVEHYKYETSECQNIVIGKVILSLDNFKEQIKGKKAFLNFLKRQTKNSRSATKKKALMLLAKLNK